MLIPLNQISANLKFFNGFMNQIQLYVKMVSNNTE